MSILDTLRPMSDLRVLVAAGAGRVGATLANAFLETGARVHVCDVDRAALDRLTAASPSISASMADASSAADVDRVFSDVQACLGGLDVLISNAGITGPTAPIEAIDSTGWERTIAVNLNSQYYFARRAVPLLRQSQRGPCMVAVGTAASPPGSSFRTPHASSQWAIAGLIKSMAIELRLHGIRVNAILPGLDDEERFGASAAHGAPGLVTSENDRPVANREPTPHRGVNPEEIAAMALFLCSPAACDLSGQLLVLNRRPPMR